MMEVITLEQARNLGLSRYFTGRPCARGHICERLVSARACLECQVHNVDKWQKENPERVNLKTKKWRTFNPAKMAASKKHWNSNHPDVIKALHSKWCRLNRGKRSAWEYKRKARKTGNGGSHTPQDILDILAAQGQRCAYFAYCGTELTSHGRHIDHIIPVVAGGSNDRSNIQLLCPSCNCSKGARDPILHCQSLGWLL